MEFVVRSKSGITFYRMKEGEEKPSKVDFFTSNNCEEVHWSKCGELCILRETTGIRVIDMKLNSERFRLDLPKVVAVSLSPLNNWLVTITPFKQEPNLQIWDMKTGELHYALVQKSFSRSLWPYLQWDSDEGCALFHHGDTITLFNGHDLCDESVQQIIRNGEDCLLSGVSIQTNSLVSLSPSAVCPAIVVFTPLKGGEGMLCYYADKSKTNQNQFTLQCQHRLMNCNEASCEWNQQGDRAVITVGSDVDSTGVSYYGRNSVYFLFNDYKIRSDYMLNIMRGEQSVQETRFSASGNQLCSITASVPATTVLMSAKECKEEGSCGKLNVNTVLWSPHGRLLLLAGFGNLSGEIHIWDNFEKKKLLQFKTDYITSCQWAPDSRHLIMGTCFPRMKIDNRLYIYKYNGVKTYEEDFDQLYEISIRPIADDVYPLRPPTVAELAEIKKTVEQKAPAKYVPPHLRNKGAGSIPGMGRKSIPGMSNRSGQRGGPRGQVSKPKSTRPPPKPKPDENVKDAIFNSVQISPPAEEVNETLTKRLRNVEKKLRDISLLKAKWDVLNEEQQSKVNKEEELQKEAEELRSRLSAAKNCFVCLHLSSWYRTMVA